MGYSLCVKFKTLQEQQRMQAFYESNSDIILSLAIAEGREFDVKNYLELHKDDRLSYAPRVKYLLGYDGASGRPYYFHLLLAWMAVKSFYRDKSKRPFFYYDHEKTYVDQPNDHLIMVNEQGFQTLDIFNKFSDLDKQHIMFTLYSLPTDVITYIKETEKLILLLNERWIRQNS